MQQVHHDNTPPPDRRNERSLAAGALPHVFLETSFRGFGEPAQPTQDRARDTSRGLILFSSKDQPLSCLQAPGRTGPAPSGAKASSATTRFRIVQQLSPSAIRLSIRDRLPTRLAPADRGSLAIQLQSSGLLRSRLIRQPSLAVGPHWR